MQQFVLYIPFSSSEYIVTILETFVDKALITFAGLVFAAFGTALMTFVDLVFAKVIDTVSVTFIVSSHKIIESSTKNFKYLLFL